MVLELHLYGGYKNPQLRLVAERLDELGILYRKVGPDGGDPEGVTLCTPFGRFHDSMIFALFGKPKSLEKKAAKV